MSLPDDQIDLLKLAATALHSWQDAAEGVGVVITQIVMEFPPDGTTNSVQFTWRPARPAVLDSEGEVIEPAVSGGFDIATLS